MGLQAPGVRAGDPVPELVRGLEEGPAGLAPELAVGLAIVGIRAAIAS
jgi:hypothetical protein